MQEPTLNQGDAGDAVIVDFLAADDLGRLVGYEPERVEYRVDCLTNAAEIKDWIDVAEVAARVVITLDADDTAILDDAHDLEQRQVTVVADRGSDSQKTERLRFWIKHIPRYGTD